MKISGRFVLAIVALFSATAIYCQTVKQKPGVISNIHFGKFLPDSVNTVTVNEIVSADSLFLKSGSESASGKIVSFDVFTLNGKLGIAESAFNNRLSKKQKMLIGKVRPTQMVYLQNITVKFAGKEKTKISSRFIFKIRY